MNELEKFDKEFIENLRNSERSDIAILKRACGKNLENAKKAIYIFYKKLPGVVKYRPNEEIYFLVATLYGFNKYSFIGDFGSTMRRVKIKTDTESIDSRFAALLDSDFDIVNNIYYGGSGLSFRLRQCIRLADSKEIGVDWYELLKDLKNWDHPDNFVKKKWARSYFFEGIRQNKIEQSKLKQIHKK
ncbi:MAG: type I-E CRISPR-associated protein Cse2/CasB [Candidatus Helarchaeota archaeon]